MKEFAEAEHQIRKLGPMGVLALSAAALQGVGVAHEVSSAAAPAYAEAHLTQDDTSAVTGTIELHETVYEPETVVTPKEIGETFISSYERDFNPDDDDTKEGMAFARNFVLTHMAELADPNNRNMKITIGGFSSPEHGNDSMAGIMTSSDKLDELSQKRANINYFGFVSAVNEAFANDPARAQQIINSISLESFVGVPTAEQIEGVTTLADKYGMSVNTLLDGFNQRGEFPGDEKELEAIKTLVRRGMYTKINYDDSETVMVAKDKVTEILVGGFDTKPRSERMQFVDDVVTTGTNLMAAENGYIPIQQTANNKGWSGKIQDEYDGGRHQPAQYEPKAVKRFIQPLRGNGVNKTVLSGKQAGKGKPGSSNHQNRKGR